jgi:hypothetical protein
MTAERLATDRRKKRLDDETFSKKMNRLLNEIERTLTLELVTLIALQRKGPPYDMKPILAMAIRVFGGMEHRSIRENAVFKFAQRQMKTMNEDDAAKGESAEAEIEKSEERR